MKSILYLTFLVLFICSCNSSEIERLTIENKSLKVQLEEARKSAGEQKILAEQYQAEAMMERNLAHIARADCN